MIIIQNWSSLCNYGTMTTVVVRGSPVSRFLKFSSIISWCSFLGSIQKPHLFTEDHRYLLEFVHSVLFLLSGNGWVWEEVTVWQVVWLWSNHQSVWICSWHLMLSPTNLTTIAEIWSWCGPWAQHPAGASIPHLVPLLLLCLHYTVFPPNPGISQQSCRKRAKH